VNETANHNTASDEAAILDLLAERLRAGRGTYGPWRVTDGRHYPREALAEVLDALHYCAAELLRLDRAAPLPQPRARKVYVCHPFADDPVANIERVRGICIALLDRGLVPVAPQLYLPQFIDELSGRERALTLCLALLEDCNEVRVYGSAITAGMHREIAHAKALGIPVRLDDTDGGRP
jgi:hypothetical protein